MIPYKLNNKCGEAETLKREIDYLSRLISNHVTRPSAHSLPNTIRPSEGVHKTKWSRNTRQEPFVLPAKHKAAVLHTPLGRNPYKFERNFKTKSPVMNERTPLVLRTKYRLVKKRTRTRSSDGTPTKRLKAARATSRTVLLSGSKCKKIVRTQFKVINRTLANVGNHRYSWKSYLRSDGSHRIILHRTPLRFPRKGAIMTSRVPWTMRSKSWKNPLNSRKIFHSLLDNVARRRSKGNKQTTHLTSINGILYNVSRTKLSRKVNGSAQTRDEKKGASTVCVFGVKYRLDATGKTLTRISESGVTATKERRSTGRIDLGRSTYMQTAPGLWTKTAATDARLFASRVVHRSIHRVLTAEQRKKNNSNRYCMFYNRFGKCLKRESCPYLHDPAKVAVCTRFLRGTCKAGSECPFSHVLEPSKMPVCSYFLQGRCSSDNCPYRHVKVPASAKVCPHFLRGFCQAGDKCKKVHTLDCPDFVSSGECAKGSKCPLRHPSRSKKEQAPANRKQPRSLEEEQAEEGTGRLPSFISIASPTTPQVSKEQQSPMELEEEKKKELQIYPKFLLR